MSVKLERNQKLLEELTSKFGCPNVFKWFMSLNEVPRPSRFTEKVTAWAMDGGNLVNGTKVMCDHRGNVSFKIPASPGKEGKPAVVLQAHLDMVPTVSAGKTFDFTKDQLEMFLDGKLLRAKDTTLGADDGSGVAIIFALAEDKTLVHGPIEVLLTVDEETGLEGATMLKEGELLSENAKYLINVDSEDFGEICLSCAGAAMRNLVLPMQRSALPSEGWRHFSATLSNLVGGHTGVDIHLGHANALKWLGLMFSDNYAAIERVPYRISKFDGGNAHNAVPSSAVASFSLPAAKADGFIAAMREIFDALNARWKRAELKGPTFVVTEEKEAPSTALTFSSTRGLCQALMAIHHGVWTWSENVESLVETSESLSVAHLRESLELTVFARTSHLTAMNVVSAHLDAVAAIFGGVCHKEGTDMSGWPAEPNSTLARSAIAVFKDVTKTDAEVTSIHAGLECGIIMGKFPKNKMEAISVGPTVKNPHTPDEFLDVESTVQLYNYLFKLVEKLAE